MTDSIATSEGSNFSLREVRLDYEDPYINDRQSEIVGRLRELEATAAEFYGQHGGHARKRLSTIDLNNPATARLIEWCPSVAHWLSLVPTAAALHQCYNPDAPEFPTGQRVDAETREWLRNIADTQGIRSRAAVMQRVLGSEVDDSRRARWLSLACGAAQPVFRTMEDIADRGRPVPDVTLADLDKTALGLAATYAATHGFTSHTQTVRANVLDKGGFSRLPSRISGVAKPSGWLESFDAVDAVGILEYLKAEDWTYTYSGIIKSKRALAGAVTFLRNAFACVKPGGLLIVGNMLTTHPQLGFTMDVIQWPHIQPRSIEEMLTIFRAAGLTGHVDVHLPRDGVYAVYAIRKSSA